MGICYACPFWKRREDQKTLNTSPTVICDEGDIAPSNAPTPPSPTPPCSPPSPLRQPMTTMLSYESLSNFPSPPFTPTPTSPISLEGFPKQRESCLLQVAFKSPHGKEFFCNSLSPCSSGFECRLDINDWIRGIYSRRAATTDPTQRWTSWICYNDQTDKLGIPSPSHGGGHTKGIVCWNEYSVSWLIHSVPEFPRQFFGVSIVNIEHSELVYGQSFCHITFPLTETLTIQKVMEHLAVMDPHVYISQNAEGVWPVSVPSSFKRAVQAIQLRPGIIHIAKSPCLHLDIYADYIGPLYGDMKVETWIRGQALQETENVIHVKKLRGVSHEFCESQDHSKWAVSTREEVPWVFIGDLNRMHSQASRGGGGFLFPDNGNLWMSLHSLIKT